jgi:serine/threonine protein kinase/WD40 repeat protein
MPQEAEVPIDPLDDAFAAFISDFEQARIDGRPLPEPPEALKARWQHMGSLFHLLEQAGPRPLSMTSLEVAPSPAGKPLGASGGGPATAVFPTILIRRRPGMGNGERPVAGQTPFTSRKIGHYRLERVLGRGGMGVVYQAHDLTLDRTVAVKMLPPSAVESANWRTRFDLEGRLLARLRHENIVQVLEAGEQDGAPYLAMEFVDGPTLHAHLGGQPLPPQEAADLAERLAKAVAHAHAAGVIHRDLKPGNVLMASTVSSAPAEPTSPGSAGTSLSPSGLAQFVPKISDFGLATTPQGGPALTATGEVLGTPGYLAPEMVLSSTVPAGPAVDIYGLGTILYETLTGRPPFIGANLAILVMHVQFTDPMPPRALNPAVPRDLETICLKCLRKEPRQRYPTAEALAEDLARFREGKPITARPAGPAELVWRWAKRNPAVAWLLACVAILLIAGSAISTWFGLDARQQAAAARHQEGLARTAETRALTQKRTANLYSAELTFQLGLQQAQAGAVDRGLFLMLRAWRQAPEDAVAFRTVIRANLAGWSRQLPRLRYALQMNRFAGGYRHILSGDPEGRTFLIGSSCTRGIRAFDSASGQPVPLAPLLADRCLWSVSQDGRWLGLSDKLGHAVFDRETGKAVPGIPEMLARSGHPYFEDLPDVVVAFDRDGKRIFWDLRTHRELPVRLHLDREDECHLIRTDDGRAIAVVLRGVRLPSPARAVRVEGIDLNTGKTLNQPLPLACCPNPAFSYDGGKILTETNGSWRWVDLATGRLQEALWGSRRQARHYRLTQDGLEVLSGEIDQYLRTYDLATGLRRGGDLLREPQTSAWGAGGSLREEYNLDLLQGGAATSSPDGRLLFTLSASGVTRVWDTSLCQLQKTGPIRPRQRLRDGPTRDHLDTQANWSADGRRVVLTRRDQDHALLLDTRTGDLLGPPLCQKMIEHAVFSPDGRYLATAACQGRNGQVFDNDFVPMVVLRDGHTGVPIAQPWVSTKLIHSLAFSPNGKFLAVGFVAGTVILDVPANRLRHILPEATCIRSLKWNADSRRLLVTARPGWPGVGGGLRLWDAVAGKPLGSFQTSHQPHLGIEASWLSPSEIVTCECQGSGLARRSGDGRTVHSKEPTGPLRLVHFSANGQRLAASTSSSTVQQWDARTGKPFGPPLRHPEPTQLIRYSPDARLLAVACVDGAVRLWDADTGWPLGPPLEHFDMPISLAFHDENRTLLCLTEAGIVRAWPIPQPIQDDPERFETWLKARGGLHLEGEEPVQESVEAWQTACHTLKQRWPQADPALAEVSDDLVPWHRRRALDAAATGNDRGELYHLRRLAALCPQERVLQAHLARVHARVAARLPAGPSRDREWQLALDAVKRQRGWRGEEHWIRLGVLEATARKADEARWYLDRLAATGNK